MVIKKIVVSHPCWSHDTCALCRLTQNIPSLSVFAAWNRLDVENLLDTRRDDIFCFPWIHELGIGPIKVHMDHKFDGRWRGERKCMDLKAGDADVWIKIWEELHRLRSEDIIVEVEHVKAHRTKKGEKHVAVREICHGGH